MLIRPPVSLRSVAKNTKKGNVVKSVLIDSYRLYQTST